MELFNTEFSLIADRLKIFNSDRLLIFSSDWSINYYISIVQVMDEEDNPKPSS